MPSKPKPKQPAPKPEAPKPEAPKPEAPKPEAPKPEAPKPDTTAVMLAVGKLGETLRSLTAGMSRADYIEVCGAFKDELDVLIEAAEQDDAAAEEDDGEG